MSEGIATARPPVSQRLEALRRWPLALELVLVVALIGVAAVIFGRSLHAATIYDEGVYLASLDALEHGQKLGAQVFASQPPGLYLLLEAERAVFGSSVTAMRVGMLVLALIGCVSAYYVGRCLAGVRGGLLVVTLLVTPTIVEDEAVRIRGVFPSVALSLFSIALAFMAVRRKGLVGLVAAALSGSALAAAVSVKLLAVTAAAPVLAVLLRRKALRLSVALAAGAAAVIGALLIVYADVLGPLWNDVVRFHLDAQSARVQDAPTSIGGNIAKVASASADFNGVRSPFLWLVIIGAVGTLLAWRRRQLLGAAPLWLWAVVSALFLIWHRPLWAHDVVILIVALAVAAGVGLAPLLSGPRRGLAAIVVVLVVVAAASIAHHLQRTSGSERSAIKWAAAVLQRRTPPGSEIASDLPIIPYLADRRQPGALVDTSRTRFGTGSLSRAEILESIDRGRVSAVVAGHLFAADPNLLQALHNRFPIVVRRTGVDLGEGRVDLRIYLRR